MARKYNSGKDHPKFIDLAGQQVGDLSVIEYVLHDSRWMWKTRCSCGELTFVRTTQLTRENPQTACKKCTDKRTAENRILPDNQAYKNRRLRVYKRGAQSRNISFKLTESFFFDLLDQACHYCGLPQSDGIDRVDSRKAYTVDNVVSCCKQCNVAKLDYSKKEFLDWVTKVYEFNKESSTTIPKGSTSQANGDGNGIHF